MPGPAEPRIIQGSDFVATVLASAEVSNVCVWAVPEVKPFVALKSDLLVVRIATRTKGIKLCLLVIERISLQHRIIELWENPLCFGYNPGVLTSKGLNNGPERMRIIFSEAAMAQEFMNQVEDIMENHRRDSAGHDWLTSPANDTRPTEAGAAVASSTPPTASDHAAGSTSEPLDGDLNAASRAPTRPTEAGAAVASSTPPTASDHAAGSTSEPLDGDLNAASRAPTRPTEAGAAVASSTPPTASDHAARSTSEPLDKGHSVSPPAPQETDPLPSPLHGASCSVTVSGDHALPVVKDDLHRLATALSQLMADRVEDRRIQTEDRRRLQTTIVDFTATMTALKESAGQNPFQDMSPLGVFQAMHHALSLLPLVNETEDATHGTHHSGLHVQLDNNSQELRAFRQSVKDLVRGLEIATASFSVLSPETKRHFQQLPVRHIKSPLHRSPLFPTSPAVAPNIHEQTQHAKRQCLEVSSPPASKRPRLQTPRSSPAMTLFMHFMASNDLTTVRFGKVGWAADVHQLRAQVYVVGKVAWDSVSALYATLRGVSRDEGEPGYACLEFPARGLGEMFVEAWETHREKTEVWAEVQAWIA